jgi:hypothetical protein
MACGQSQSVLILYRNVPRSNARSRSISCSVRRRLISRITDWFARSTIPLLCWWFLELRRHSKPICWLAAARPLARRRGVLLVPEKLLVVREPLEFAAVQVGVPFSRGVQKCVQLELTVSTFVPSTSVTAGSALEKNAIGLRVPSA